jgi:VIT family
MSVAAPDEAPESAPHHERPGPGLDASDAKEAIFGSFDGMTSTLGVVAGLLATKSSAPHIVAGAIGIAVAATIGMGAGQYLSDGQRNLRKAVVMAVATLIRVRAAGDPLRVRDLARVRRRFGGCHIPHRGRYRPLPRVPSDLRDPHCRLCHHRRPVHRGRMRLWRAPTRGRGRDPHRVPSRAVGSFQLLDRFRVD